jgi:hypothetical protein
MIWSAVEINLGILAATMPCLKPLFKKILEKSLASTSRSHLSGGNHQHEEEPPDAKASSAHNPTNVSSERLLFEAPLQTTSIPDDRLRLDRSLARAAQGMELDDIRVMYAEANRPRGAPGKQILSDKDIGAL